VVLEEYRSYLTKFRARDVRLRKALEACSG